MSPLARIRQVAACIPVPALMASVALAAGPAPQPTPPGGPPPASGPDQPVLLAPKGSAQLARSALLTVNGTATDDSLQLSVRRVSDKSAVTDGEITVTVDGKNEPVMHGNGGVYEIAINDLRGDGSKDSAKDVEIIVPHDGIREILSGKVAVVQGSSGGSLLGDHKQIAWWILNIAIVLIAALALSRRKG